MNSSSEHLNAVRNLVADEPAAADDRPAALGRLQRLCRAARRDLPASGVGVSFMSESGDLLTAAASSRTSALLEELQFTLGEGPCLTAFASRSPVLVPDLSEEANESWPSYVHRARDHGVRAVFAFPLVVGAARLGALDVYRGETGSLSTWALSRAMTYADVAMQTMIDAQGSDGDAGLLLLDGADTRLEVYQAQGMVMVQLGISADDALARMRAHAFAENTGLSVVADDILARRLVLEPHTPDP